MQSFNLGDHSARNGFEHKIVLYYFDQEISDLELLNYISEKNSEKPYKVETGEFIYWKMVKLIDTFELNHIIEFENNTEVYSRFFATENLTLEDVITMHFSDYVWQDDKKLDKYF